LLVVAGDHRRLGFPGERLDQGALGLAGVLGLVDQQVGEAAPDRLGEGGPLREQAGQLEHAVDVVHRSRGAKHRVVQLVDLGELALAGCCIPLGARPAALLIRPPSEPLGRHPRRLERVDPVDDQRQQARWVPPDLVAAQRQLV
jgi:hypothetical protein